MYDLLDFIGPVRKDLVLTLKQRGSATAAELAEVTYLSIAAARAHLLVLERTGLVTYERVRDGVGRPAHVYRLSEYGEALFPQAYAALSKSLISSAQEHPECRSLIWEALADWQRVRVSAGVTAQEPALRIEQLAGAMQRQGFAVELRKSAPAEWEMRMAHCPLLQVARDFPEMCAIERRVLAESAGPGVEVEHVSRQAAGEPVCIAVLRWPATAVPIPVA